MRNLFVIFTLCSLVVAYPVQSPPTLKGPQKASMPFLSEHARAIVLAVSMGSLTWGAAAAGATDANVAKGSQLFQGTCAGCHAGGQNFVAEKRTLRKEDILLYRKSLDQAVIQKFIQNEMPHKFLPIKDWSEQDYVDVTAFVLDQAVGEKW